jgi:hypothetical protein
MPKIIDNNKLPYSDLDISYGTSRTFIIEMDGGKKRIKNEVIIENRNRVIDSVINDLPYKEMKIEDHIEYKRAFHPPTLSELMHFYSHINV